MYSFQYVLIFVFCSVSLISAQQYRFTYSYTSIPDTLNKNHIINENMILEIDKDRSVFISQKKIISDSIMKEDAKKGIMTMPDENINTRSIIIKKYPDFKTSIITDEFSTSYKFVISDDRSLNWVLSTEKKMIGSYECQKAELDFAGRKWTAWFTEEIPFNDGPYKFKGLPGLIVEIKDASNSHCFQLIGIQKIKDSYIPTIINEKKKSRSFTYTDFVKFYKEYRKDPTKEFRQKTLSGDIYYESEEERLEHMRLIENLRKERIKKDNNIIEIDWLKDK
ncbi:GLPGLI family protein [Chryseobacterium lactis]|uniref:GLPGLI family protein n=1 Tax=Chryseobacterium lactis TaxID=1241981 RepID=A0A3G6RFT8_CHRLC|nr:GLPGLI family protein [Chryseobacterium lactis]AZA82331.1 GLPGLI family protein [Chryseobacterium lactis]AZB02713.1 GLPGLI family protein [Chryseobacterium lactis]PNW13994.1 GLPGLI family protein [Chryseobacterium lactis]